MHDIIWFETQGIPSVAIASEEFKNAATIQAVALGMSDAKRVFVQHPIQDASDKEIYEKADSVVEKIKCSFIMSTSE